MHAIKLLHKTIKNTCPNIHKTRLNSLTSAVKALSNNGVLTVTGLGRASYGSIQEKNKIKKTDRLVGNVHIQKELIDIYKSLAHLLIGSKKHPVLIADWASVDERNKFQVLKVAIAYEGRAITIYDQIEYTDRPKLKDNNSHDQFIKNLSKILPKDCKPIIVTDAGFTAKWFKRIVAKGWYFVGRVRGLVKLREENQNVWQPCKKLFKEASFNPKYLGKYSLAKSNSIKCDIYIYKSRKKGRVAKNKIGTIKKSSYKMDYAKSANEPWLLATNLPRSCNIAKKIIKFYKARMQIEETIRDNKSLRYGFGVSLTLSNTKERVAVLMLIAALTHFALGIIGTFAYQTGIFRHYQANTTTNTRVLSIHFLGQQILQNLREVIPKNKLLEAVDTITHGILTYETQ